MFYDSIISETAQIPKITNVVENKTLLFFKAKKMSTLVK